MTEDPQFQLPDPPDTPPLGDGLPDPGAMPGTAPLDPPPDTFRLPDPPDTPPLADPILGDPGAMPATDPLVMPDEGATPPEG